MFDERSSDSTRNMSHLENPLSVIYPYTQEQLNVFHYFTNVSFDFSEPQWKSKSGPNSDSSYIRVEEGESFELNCKANGWPRPSVIWLLNETNVRANDALYEVNISSRQNLLSHKYQFINPREIFFF